MAMTTAAAAEAEVINARRDAYLKQRASVLAYAFPYKYYKNHVLIPMVGMAPTGVTIVTITCLRSGKTNPDALGRLLVVPSSFEELKHVGMTIYGPTFYKAMVHNGAYFTDIELLKSGDLVVFVEETMAWNTITITCLEKEDAAEKLLVVPLSLEQLKQVGVMVYGAKYTRVMDEQGNEINDVEVLRNGDRIVYASREWAEETKAQAMIMLTITCLEKGDSVGRLLVLPRWLNEVRWVGAKIYGAHCVKMFDEEGFEINDIRRFRDGDWVDYASNKWAKEANAWITITITCYEMGDFVGKLLVLPGSLMRLKVIGAKIYDYIYDIVMNEEGVEIDDIRVLRNGDCVVFTSEKWVKKLNAHKRVEESNAQEQVEESNAQKWVEESNAPVTVTCSTPIMRVLRGLW